jgi:hypothetical protein
MLRSDGEPDDGASGVPTGEPRDTASATGHCGQRAPMASEHALPAVCARVSAQLPALHAETLAVAATQAALDHIAACGACAVRFEQGLADVYGLLRADPLPVPLPASPRDLELRATLYARLAAERRSGDRPEERSGRLGQRELRAAHTAGSLPPVPRQDDLVADRVEEDSMNDSADDNWESGIATATPAGSEHSTPAPASPAAPTHVPASRTERRRRVSRWLASVAAVLVVALLAGTLLTHGRGQRPQPLGSTTAHVTTPTTSPLGPSGGPCTPQRVTVALPDRATIFDLTMISPSEGWLVGAIFAADYQTPQAGLILHLRNCQWQPVSDPLPAAFLNSIAMVSPTEGWVTGYTHSGNNYLLHLTDGHWHQVTPPYHATDDSYFGGIKMRSPEEGWLVVNSKSSFEPPIWSLLLHYQHGTWSQVTVPVPTIWDFAPVGPDELWLVGNTSTQVRQDSTLAHYRAGQWTTTLAPGHVLLNTLRLLSPTDGYAVGWQPQSANAAPGPPPPAAVLQFDGAHWQPLQTGADVRAQTVVLFDHRDGWAFVQLQPPSPTSADPPPPPNTPIATAQHEVGGHWQNVPWPFTDVIAIGTVVRAAPGEYWASALTQQAPGVAADFHWELLHFVNGVWTAYGPQ